MSRVIGDELRALAIGRGFFGCCASSRGRGRWCGWLRCSPVAGLMTVDGVGVDEHQDGRVGVGGADAEVVQASGAAQGEFAVAVDDVDADAVVDVGLVLLLVGWGGFRGVVVGGGGGVAVGAVGAVVVVDGRNASSWCCRSGTVWAAGWVASQRFRVWWKRSILPWVWGWPGWPFFWVIASSARRYSKPLRPPRKREV